MAFTKEQEEVEALSPQAAQKLSQIAFAFGASYGVRSTCIPAPEATRPDESPYLLSLSRIGFRGPSPLGVALRRCWATQASEGLRFTAEHTEKRDSSSMMMKTNSARKQRS